MHRRRLGQLVILGTFLALGPSNASAQDCDRARHAAFQWTEENDAVAVASGSDESYTQGMRFLWTYMKRCGPAWAGARGAAGLQDWGDRLRAFLYPEAADAESVHSVGFGQNFFTPNDISRPDLIADDRPYAGWLYTNLAYAVIDSKFAAAARAQHQFELQLGLLGPEAQGEWVQREFHRLINNRLPKGWDNQLATEPGLQLFYAYQRRFVFGHGHIDAIPALNAAVGNLQDFVGAGATLRLGTKNMRAFPVTVISANAAAVQAEDRGRLELFAFVGAEGRAVARNIFLDGNTFRTSHHVDKETFVYDLKAGFSLRYDSWRLSYSFIRRSREFAPDPAGVDASRHDYGSVSFSWERDIK